MKETKISRERKVIPSKSIAKKSKKINEQVKESELNINIIALLSEYLAYQKLTTHLLKQQTLLLKKLRKLGYEGEL